MSQLAPSAGPLAEFALLELPHRFGEPGVALEQLSVALDKLRPAPGTCVALPEQCFTGYVSPQGDFDLTPFALFAGSDPVLTRCAALARAFDIALFVPHVERWSGRCYNSYTYLWAGRATTYRKRHPWYPETWATPGHAPHPLVTLPSGRQAAMAVCFDLHFLADEAASALSAADVLVFASAWVEDGGDERFTTLPALARRFDVAIANPNWGVGAPRVATQGASLLVDASGAIIGETPRTPGAKWLTPSLLAAL